jgi:uncharacterized protein (TIGR02246 family)
MATDLERIEELHHADMRASKARDYKALRALMSDDAVVLPPGGQLIRGREALDKSFAAMVGAAITSDVQEYRFEWQEVRVCGEFAYEWGYIVGSERDRSSGKVTSATYQVMRILERQSDGAWKVHRTIWNEPAR